MKSPSNSKVVNNSKLENSDNNTEKGNDNNTELGKKCCQCDNFGKQLQTLILDGFHHSLNTLLNELAFVKTELKSLREENNELKQSYH